MRRASIRRSSVLIQDLRFRTTPSKVPSMGRVATERADLQSATLPRTRKRNPRLSNAAAAWLCALVWTITPSPIAQSARKIFAIFCPKKESCLLCIQFA